MASFSKYTLFDWVHFPERGDEHCVRAKCDFMTIAGNQVDIASFALLTLVSIVFP
jgi:hypothetical protein